MLGKDLLNIFKNLLVDEQQHTDFLKGIIITSIEHKRKDNNKYFDKIIIKEYYIRLFRCHISNEEQQHKLRRIKISGLVLLISNEPIYEIREWIIKIINKLRMKRKI